MTHGELVCAGLGPGMSSVFTVMTHMCIQRQPQERMKQGDCVLTEQEPRDQRLPGAWPWEQWLRQCQVRDSKDHNCGDDESRWACVY